MALTDKRRAFVTEYPKDFNATQAAIRAGFSKKTAYAQGQRLLKNVEVIQALAELAQEAHTDAVMGLREVQEWWSRIVQGHPVTTDVPGPHADADAIIRSLPDIKDRLKASELLVKSQGGFVDRQETSGDLTIRVRRD